ncbi:peptidase M76 family-domain-containing protein [Lentinula aciculospora]|uniref:Mitochondrial inner membrane protease ATP23 n=1 Tax=Lentinula aciculospora TaxID=153920 RepID=A0A9W9AHE7_9AGAR|nr:peptidase M76 family-domain-containing protein [Lentinula aciculospora]
MSSSPLSSSSSSPNVNNSANSANPSSNPSSAFNHFLHKAQLITGIGVTDAERTKDLEELNLRRCEKMKNDLMERSPLIIFMLKHLRLSGCQVPEQNIFCVPCASPFASTSTTASLNSLHPASQTSSDSSSLNTQNRTQDNGPTPLHAGAYLPHPHGAIKLCAGHFFSKQHVESTIAHELIHMFDECRFKVDWANLRHHACSEIRANNLSGDCRWTRELRRGEGIPGTGWTKGHQACIRRRAITSVAANPACPTLAHAERAVNEVWESCFVDTRPFDEVY